MIEINNELAPLTPQQMRDAIQTDPIFRKQIIEESFRITQDCVAALSKADGELCEMAIAVEKENAGDLTEAQRVIFGTIESFRSFQNVYGTLVESMAAWKELQNKTSQNQFAPPITASSALI